mgnify:CR=1 FL=1
MIIKQSKVKVIDNSGVALGQCIHVYGKKVASIGDEILIAVKRIRRVKSSFTKGVGKTTRIQKGGTYPALVVWAKKPVKAADGSFMSFDENAVVILNAYVFRRYKFHPDNRPRRISGIFTSEFDGTKVPLLEEQEVCKGFKAFIFSIRSNVYNYAPSGWTIIEEPEVGWLGELVAEPSSIFDSF